MRRVTTEKISETLKVDLFVPNVYEQLNLALAWIKNWRNIEDIIVFEIKFALWNEIQLSTSCVWNSRYSVLMKVICNIKTKRIKHKIPLTSISIKR